MGGVRDVDHLPNLSSWLTAIAPKPTSIATSTISPGQVSPQLMLPMNPCRTAVSTWLTGLTAATSCSQPASSASGAYAAVNRTNMNVPVCISGAADCVLKISASETPQQAITAAKIIPIAN